MIRRLSVGAQFGIIAMVSTALVLAVALTVANTRLERQDALQSESNARETSARLATAVQSVFEVTFSSVANTSDTLVAFADRGLRSPEVYDTLLKRMLDDTPNAFGAWLSVDLENATGAARFDTYWHQNGMDQVREVVPSDIYSSDLYRVPFTTQQRYLLEPHEIDARNGDPMLVTSLAAPVERNGKTLGVLAVDVKLDAIADAINDLQLPTGASITVVSDGGVVAMSTKKGLPGKPIAMADSALRSVFDEARRGDGSKIEPTGVHNAPQLTSWTVISFGGARNPWYLLMTVPEGSLLARDPHARLTLFMIAVGAVAANLLLVLFVMRRLVTEPLRNISSIIEGLTRNEFGFQVPGCGRSDEVGDIARAVERLQDSGIEIARLQETNGEREWEREVARRSELDSISTRFSRSIESVVAVIGAIAATIGKQSNEVLHTAQTAAGRLGGVSEASSAARETLTSVAEATRSLTTTINDIGERTRSGRMAAEKLERHSTSTYASISRLQMTLGQIDAVSSLIRDVAGQINMIALNATIEAARAGEAGRGFAVVASEIKLLAKNTAAATDEISGLVTAVHDASRAAEGDFTVMKKAISELHVISAEIAGALDVQLGATDNISGVVNIALDGAETVARHVSELVHSSGTVQGAADVMIDQSGTLAKELAALDGEVQSFIGFLRAA